ncbi:formate dehydrogenase accessory sulfurtransferase FdhD [Aureimonas phyllosphaerae]|uniref:Sulfur carrier protein FdhD n=1 Tax=Aureimonas phyllosphaerae TaxID=1166078 RepID=A0A7W6BS97_9HYPH|nr:formate dehydrogenase accessory sulfurtransferase FdhD [Aureimonas phyllosphaerae]MBB3937118.1 FdhD protein [Aureimonas phyllosphaerae]MBB3961245.1 FdhD protein [Aureimonas phyllosphaerae]SFF52094.1 FdhD protein [Aureimonas phyllosphaerae]
MPETSAHSQAWPAATVRFRAGRFEAAMRDLPAEVAVAVSVNGSTHAVMMATPADLPDLALGLALNEGIAANPAEIERLDVEATEVGIDCRLWLTPERAAGYVARKRQMTGPVGCGLCGVESLELAARALPTVAGRLAIGPEVIVAAMDAMGDEQRLGRRTRAAHAAAFATANGELVVVREDVGRHNALDKVAGHLASAGIDPAGGFLVLTSRVSVELIQKAAMMGCGLLAAVSVPTLLAVGEAERAGVTLVAVVRGEEFEVFTHPGRIEGAGALSAAG